MKHPLIRLIIIKHNEPVVHDAARSYKGNRDVREFHLKVRIITGMQMIPQIITEYRYSDTRFHALKQPERLDIDVIVDQINALRRLL